MLYKVSCILTKLLMERLDEDKCDAEVYIYGFELIISTIIGLASIILISWGMSDTKAGFLFIAIFVPLRIFTGGYHATTYGRCYAISNFAYVIVLLIKKLFWNDLSVIVWFCILLVVSFYIEKKAPIINKAQPINEYKQKRSKDISRYILLVDIILSTYLLIIKDKELLSMVVLSICLVSVFMLITDKSIFTKKQKGEDKYGIFSKVC